ncbi:arrestin domain-containing protein 17-like isoform X2 [Neocloeon triangulifer]|nr:arrestin domain-containing protein 17-like isoform X2 [Neocloeon triangulifer]XP_059473872.1 arrestin domain-containing protein 17-like isoform X2 [Neocloeon triangulifer]
MGLEKFQIFFDNPQAVFYAGQNVSGRIVVVNSTPKKIRGINVKIKGEAEVSWTETRQHSSDSNNTTMDNVTTTPNNTTTDTQETFSAEEVYFENKFVAFGGGGDQTLNPGEHMYPFNYVLPINLPSSFEGEFGHVRYTVRAVLDRPWKFDQEAKAAFTVISPLDLNADPKLAAPVTKQKSKKFCCWCCASNPVNIVLTLPTGGAVPGETLLPTLDIENNSRVYLSLITLKLVKSVTYKARGGNTKKVEVSIAEKNLGYVDSGQSHTFEREALQIPPLPPSNLNNCSVIDLEYYLEAHFSPSSFYCSFQVRLPVVVGTIPLSLNFAQYAPAVQNPPLGWNFSPSAPHRDGSPNYPDLPPPTYEASVFGARSTVERTDNQFVFGEKNFAPMYPVYHHS